MHKILIVDDDLEMLKLMKNALELKNYAVTLLSEVTLPIDIAEFQGYDLILLDIMLTNIDGIALCEKIRSQVTTPIIFVSAKDAEADILAGLESGGDDYIVKPFSLKQLVAKVKADLKREERTKEGYRNFKTVRRSLGPVTFYLEEKQVCIAGSIVELTKREYAILELLSFKPERIYTREEIYFSVYDESSEALFHSISEYVYQIRNKFSKYGIDPIKTVRGMGYKWNEQ